MADNRKIESHSSLLTNRGVMGQKFYIDELAMHASNSMHYSKIREFYNAVEVWYMGIKDILDENVIERIKKSREEYETLARLVFKYPKQFQNYKVLQQMLNRTKEIYSEIISDLQRYEYFFRVGTRQQKGLGKIDFGDSIFRKKVEGDNELQGEDEE